MKIFVGYDIREDIAYQVCEHSINKHQPQAQVISLKQSELRDSGIYTRPVDSLSSTEFTFTRFLVPYLTGYQGWAVFVDCDVVFVGGSTSWKWRNLRMWTENFPRVHVGRVNSLRLLLLADKSGADSCDGPGWCRDPTRTKELEFYLSGNHDQGDLFEL